MQHTLFIYLFKINSLLAYNNIPEQKQQVIRNCANKLAMTYTATRFINNNKKFAVRLDQKEAYRKLLDLQFTNCLKGNK